MRPGCVKGVLMMFFLMVVSAVVPGLTNLGKVEATEKRAGPGEEYGRNHTKNLTADHSKFDALKKDFQSGPEVTRACLSCHTEAAKQVQKTIHWTWLCPADTEKELGKAGLVANNFCISIHANEPRCTSCHVGYGWKDKTFDFTAEDRVDCLICHEQTGTYKKFPTGAGNPVSEPTVFKGNGKMYQPPEWQKVAQSVGRPTRRNCGVCHFFGGGGEGVKHGDLDASIFKPNKALDVHMNMEGENFNCTRCHTTEKHAISGRCYKTPATEDRRTLLDSDLIKRIACYSCHTETPHDPGVKANDHTDKVACQTCHIPRFARVNSTKMSWDWSTAGKKDENRKAIVKKENGRPVYHTKKGSFEWAKNVVPEYRWFNGIIKNVLLNEKIDPGKRVELNYPLGSYDDPNARIYPFKMHTGRQPYDKIHKTMVAPKLFGPKGSGAYWSQYEWKVAIEKGMEYAGLPFSGEYGFVDTAYYFQTTHMVAPEKDALSCAECHTQNGRMANLAGFYMPGRDKHRVLDMVGWAGSIMALIAVFLHGMARLITGRNRRG